MEKFIMLAFLAILLFGCAAPAGSSGLAVAIQNFTQPEQNNSTGLPCDYFFCKHLNNDLTLSGDYYLVGLPPCINTSQISYPSLAVIDGRTQNVTVIVDVCNVGRHRLMYRNSKNDSDWFLASGSTDSSHPRYISVFNSSGTFYSREYTVRIDSSLDEFTRAAVLRHELCHVEQNMQNRPYDEVECYIRQLGV